MVHLGIRHVALNVSDPQLSKAFYTRVLKMRVEWEPDPENVYMTSEGQDNLALHKASFDAKSVKNTPQILDHIGVFVENPSEVDSWYAHVKSEGAKIVREIKTHRDGARSFYFEDPDGIIIQLLYHVPVSEAQKQKKA